MTRLHHVGMLFPTRGAALEAAKYLQGTAYSPSLLADWDRVEAFACACAFPAPGIEFVVPDKGSRLARYLTRSETALHHLALLVPDVHVPLPGGHLIFREPAQGVQGLLVNFMDPAHGVLVELVQDSPAARALMP